ncbi:MAG: hypothetical protein S4CHLAM81_13220 [Chlamydiales bacterium]|nr:hypothetical protein [Chlamydiales bacterium]MCH9636094.1 hypothetical protein [Chlamydiales bacterium]MCH9703149.1 polyprenyl synthetase family protein [Chlamydiota bacterium]
MDRLEEAIQQALPDSPTYEAARYALLSGGKRVRPKLVLLTAELLGGDVDRAYAPAVALEMVHTYSLIHDDLPCMDDDDYRRGKPSVHCAFDEATAVLAGDLLLTHAFGKLKEEPQLVPILAEASGGEGMVGGQLLDIQHCEDLDRLHGMKTAALFRCALHFGAVIARVDPAPYIEFGQLFGLLFQAADDLQDDDPLASQKRATALLKSCHKKLPHPGFKTVLQQFETLCYV